MIRISYPEIQINFNRKKQNYIHINRATITEIYISNLTIMEKFMWKPVAYKNHGLMTQRPCPRWGHCCCTVGDEVVFFGGYACKFEDNVETIYMNDLWVFNTISMKWTEIQTSGTSPSPRSNCSASYDKKNNRIYFFGGGGSNKMRYNSISVLDWQTKTWSEIKYSGTSSNNLESQKLPWERTYHTAELLYPYLVVYGG